MIPGSSYIGVDRSREFPEIQKPKQCIASDPFSMDSNQHNETVIKDIGTFDYEEQVRNNPLIRNLYPPKSGKVFISPTINFLSIDLPLRDVVFNTKPQGRNMQPAMSQPVYTNQDPQTPANNIPSKSGQQPAAPNNLPAGQNPVNNPPQTPNQQGQPIVK